MRRTNIQLSVLHGRGIAMALKKIIGTAAIAGALGLSAIGLAGVASATPAPQAAPGAVQHLQLDGWRGGGRHDGDWRGDRGWHGDRDWNGDRGWHGDRDWNGDRGWGGPGW
jgi:hypothetical protein